jgi:hypothetical protein
VDFEDERLLTTSVAQAPSPSSFAGVADLQADTAATTRVGAHSILSPYVCLASQRRNQLKCMHTTQPILYNILSLPSSVPFHRSCSGVNNFHSDWHVGHRVTEAKERTLQPGPPLELPYPGPARQHRDSDVRFDSVVEELSAISRQTQCQLDTFTDRGHGSTRLLQLGRPHGESISR